MKPSKSMQPVAPKSKPKPKKRKAAWKWGAAHNKARRDKYKNDPAYRDRVQSRNKSSYRSLHPVEDHYNILARLGQLKSYGRRRFVVIDGRLQRILTYTHKEVAKFIGTHSVCLFRWVGKGVWPRANTLLKGALEGQPGGYVYTHDQAANLLRCFAECLSQKAFVAKTDKEAIEKLHQAIRPL